MKRIELKPYQKKAVRFALKKKRCAFFIDPGMGKTATALMVVKRLKKRKKIRSVLVVASITIMDETWPSEIKKWKQFRGLSFTKLHGRKKEQNLSLKRDIYLINPEGLAWLSRFDKKFDALIVDESSKFKNHKSQRFKSLKKKLPDIKYRYIMSGTPAANSYQDLYSQIYIVDNGATFGTFITPFMKKYFYLANPTFFKYEIKPGSKKLIEKKIAPLAYVLKNTKIKKPIFNYIKIRLDPAARKIYSSMEKELFAEIDKEDVFALSKASAYNKCQQISNGALYVDDDIKVIHDLKVRALEDLVSELQGKSLLVGYRYRHDILQIKKKFRNAPHIGGDVSLVDRRKIIKKWNKGETPLLLGQLSSVSHGLNLQGSGCSDVCYFSLTDDLDVYEQFYRRIYGRHGSKSTVRVHHLVCRNTVDLAILRRLKSKNKVQISLLESLKRYRDSKR